MLLLRVLSVTMLFLLSGFAAAAAEGSAPGFPVGVVPVYDPVSSACLACHDGSEGFRIRYCLPSQKGTGCGGHVIGADYGQLADRNPHLRPKDDLPPDLVFFEGKITCVSCHGGDPHNVALVMANEHSELCRTCHLK